MFEMPQLDFITFWLFCPIYYIWIQWHVLLFIFVSLVSFYFFSYKFYSKELNWLALAIIRAVTIFYYKLLSVWFSLYFFSSFNKILISNSGLKLLEQDNPNKNVIIRLFCRILDYMIVASQGAFGWFIKWLTIFFLGNVVIWITIPVYVFIFGPFNFGIQIVFAYVILAGAILCFKYGLWEPAYVWNLYDPFNHKPWLNEWEDVEVVDLKPWHLQTLHGTFIIAFSWVFVRYAGMWALPQDVHWFPNMFMYRDLEELGWGVESEIYDKSFFCRVPLYPVTGWEFFTFQHFENKFRAEYDEYYKKNWRKEMDLKFFHEIYGTKLGHIRNACQNYDPKTGRYYVFHILSVEDGRQERNKIIDLKNALYKMDHTYRETRKRHKLGYFPMWMRVLFCMPFVRSQKQIYKAFLHFLEYKNTWSNRSIHFSDYYANQFNNRYFDDKEVYTIFGDKFFMQSKTEIICAPHTPGLNKWYVSGYLLDVYQKQLIDLHKLYRLFLVYDSIVFKLEHRSVTVPEFRVLAELSVMPAQELYNKSYPHWEELFSAHRSVNKRIARMEEIKNINLQRTTAEYAENWKRDLSDAYKQLEVNRRKMEDMFRQGSKLNWDDVIDELIERSDRRLAIALNDDDVFYRESVAEGRLKEYVETIKGDEIYRSFLDLRNITGIDFTPEFFTELNRSTAEVLKKISYLYKNVPLPIPAHPRWYVSNLGNNSIDPLSIDLDLRFVEWHPVIGLLSPQDFSVQPIEQIRSLTPVPENHLYQKNTVLGWIRDPLPLYAEAVDIVPSRYSDAISYASQKSYDKWLNFYATTLNLELLHDSLSDEKYAKTFDPLKLLLANSELSTRMLLQELFAQKLVKPDAAEASGPVSLQLPHEFRPFFFDFGPSIKNFYPDLVNVSWHWEKTLKRTDKVWLDSTHGIAGVQLVQDPFEVNIPSYGGIPLTTLHAKVYRKVYGKQQQLDQILWEKITGKLRYVFSDWFMSKGQNLVSKYEGLEPQEKRRVRRWLDYAIDNGHGHASSYLSSWYSVGRMPPREKEFFLYRVWKTYQVYMDTWVFELQYALFYFTIWYKALFLEPSLRKNFINEEFLSIKSKYDSYDPFWYMSHAERTKLNSYRLKFGWYDKEIHRKAPRPKDT